MSLVAVLKYDYFTLSGGGLGVSVYINIIDSATNQPANGNNTVVHYTQTIGGISQAMDAIIPGQSFRIYNGAYDPSQDNWLITGTEPGTGGGSNPLLCDLAINSVVVSSPETSADANDGKISVNASSSYGPIQYSLDNITFQLSNIFTGLAGGSGTVYAKDSNDCTASLSFFVPTAAGLLIKDPSVDLGNGNISRWSTAFNPIYFIYQRKDFRVTGVVDAGDGLHNLLVYVSADVSKLKEGADSNINGATIHTDGDFVYLKTAHYDGVFEVLAVNTGTLVLAGTFTQADDDGFVNINALRPYYEIQTKITYIDPLTGKSKTITQKNQPLTNGYCLCDFSSFLRSLLQAKDYSDYSQLNYRDMQLSASYQVQYAEVWDNNTPIWNVITNPFYVLYAAMQLGAKGGGNMMEYVPFLQNFQLAKWVTEFKNPVYNVGYPFDLGFIFSEYMVGIAPYYEITLLDINMQPIPGQSTFNSFLANEDGSLLLNQDGSRFIIASQILSGVPIAKHVGLNRLLINFTPVDKCWFFKLELKYTKIGRFDYVNTQSAAPLIDSKLQISDNGTPVVNQSGTGSGSVDISPGNDFAIKAYGLTALADSEFFWSNKQSADPSPYIDCNMQLKDNGTEIVRATGDEVGSNVITQGHDFNILAWGDDSTTSLNPKLTLIVVRDGVTVFSKTIAYTPGVPSGLTYAGTSGIGRRYSITAYTTDGGANVPTVNIPDVADNAKLQLTVKKNSVIVFNNVISYVPGLNNGLSYNGTSDEGAVYEVTSQTVNNLAAVTPVNIPDAVDGDSTPGSLMQPIICRIDKNTPDRSVYLRWIGLTGSWNYYRFVFNQDIALDVSDATTIKNLIIDWENEDTIEDVISKNAAQKMTVYAENISVDDIKGCQSIKYSPKVQMLVSNSPVKWQTVLIQTGTFSEYSTMLKQGSFSITFSLPSINIQTQ